MARAPLIAFPRKPDPSLPGVPIAELKQHLLLFVATPPGPKTFANVIEAYFDIIGDAFVEYGSTAFGSERQRWTQGSRRVFLSSQLPRLRQLRDWGYSFSDGKGSQSQLVMIHGYRPVSEEGRASFYRFEFGWEFDHQTIRNLAEAVLAIVECTSGTGGYMFQGIPRGPGGLESWNTIYAWARRYWGVEVQDLDITVNHVLDRLKCISWLTAVGPALEAVDGAAIEAARSLPGVSAQAIGPNTLFQLGPQPELADRNRGADLSTYEALAQALRPVQVEEHGSFGDGFQSRWDDESTMAWLNRFTEPDFGEL